MATKDMSNQLDRAIRRIAGNDTYELQIGAVVDQVYRLSVAIPQRQQILSMSAVTESGTVDLTVQKVDAEDQTIPVDGLEDIEASATKATTSPTGDGSEVVEAGETLQIECSANAAAINLSITIRYKRLAGNNEE